MTVPNLGAAPNRTEGAMHPIHPAGPMRRKGVHLEVGGQGQGVAGQCPPQSPPSVALMVSPRAPLLVPLLTFLGAALPPP